MILKNFIGFYYKEINMVTNMNYARLTDSQLVKLAKSGKFDALSELWSRHEDFVKKVTLNQYYKIRPDFSEDCRDSEKLWLKVRSYDSAAPHDALSALLLSVQIHSLI